MLIPNSVALLLHQGFTAPFMPELNLPDLSSLMGPLGHVLQAVADGGAAAAGAGGAGAAGAGAVAGAGGLPVAGQCSYSADFSPKKVTTE